MSRIFIIDTENTNQLGFLDYYNVNCYDSVYFLFNRNSKKLDWSSVKDLFYINCNVEFIELEPTGIPSGLDFQISNFLGTLLERFNKMINSYYIISKDRGFLANKGLIQSLYEDITFEVINPDTCLFLGNEESDKSINDSVLIGLPSLKTNKEDSQPVIELIKLKAKELGYSESESLSVCEAYKKYKNNLSMFHNKLVSCFGNNGKTLYSNLKRII